MTIPLVVLIVFSLLFSAIIRILSNAGRFADAKRILASPGALSREKAEKACSPGDHGRGGRLFLPETFRQPLCYLDERNTRFRARQHGFGRDWTAFRRQVENRGC